MDDKRHVDSISKLTHIYSIEYLQFEDEDHLVLILKGIVEVDKLAVMEVVHDVNLLADKSLLHCMTNWDELSSIDMLGLELTTTMDLGLYKRYVIKV